MNELFADTFYFIALLSPADRAHDRARDITAARRSTLVTSAWVLTELADGLSHHDTREAFLQTLRALQADPTAVIVGLEQSWYDLGRSSTQTVRTRTGPSPTASRSS